MRTVVAGIMVLLTMCGTGRADTVDPRAQAVLDKAAQAEKARAAKKYATYYEESAYVTYDDKGAVTARGIQKNYAKGNRSRFSTIEYDAQQPGGAVQSETHFVFDGTDGWLVSSYGGKKKFNDTETRVFLKRAEEQAVPGRLADIRAADPAAPEQPEDNAYADYRGTEKIGGVVCHVVETGHIDNGVKDHDATAWIDDRGTIVQDDFAGLRLERGDFRKVKGARIAFAQCLSIGGKKIRESTITAVRINEPLDDSLFDPDLIAVSPGTGKPGMADGMMQPAEDPDDQPAAPQQEKKDNAAPGTGTQSGLKKAAGKQILRGFFGTVLP